ncbi:hypothetical protein C0993_009646, partial [Termitomyces sp. T159_Od127]
MPTSHAAHAPPPQIVIRTPPPQKSSTLPVDFYTLMKQAIKCNANNTIITVLQFSPSCKPFLASMRWPVPSQRFVDQADFGHIANQKGLADKLSATFKLLDHTTTDDSLNVKALFSFTDMIIQIKDNHCKALCRAEEEQDVKMI